MSPHEYARELRRILGGGLDVEATVQELLVLRERDIDAITRYAATASDSVLELREMIDLYAVHLKATADLAARAMTTNGRQP